MDHISGTFRDHLVPAQDSSDDDDGDGDGNGVVDLDDDDAEQPRKRQRAEPRQTRSKVRHQDMEELEKRLPQASVCIEMGSCLWPGEDAQFTDGVQEVFLQSGSDTDDDEALGSVFNVSNRAGEDDEWSREERNRLREYAPNEKHLQDADGSSLDLRINDPKYMDGE